MGSLKNPKRVMFDNFNIVNIKMSKSPSRNKKSPLRGSPSKEEEEEKAYSPPRGSPSRVRNVYPVQMFRDRAPRGVDYKEDDSDSDSDEFDYNKYDSDEYDYDKGVYNYGTRREFASSIPFSFGKVSSIPLDIGGVIRGYMPTNTGFLNKALLKAIFKKNPNSKQIKYLINQGASLKDIWYGAAMLAVELNRIDVIEYLHANGVDDIASDDVLQAAIWEGHLDMIKYLIKLVPTANRNAAAYSAVGYGHLDVVKYLFTHGADITFNNGLIAFAALSGHLDVIKYLFTHGADLSLNHFALQVAAETGHLNVVKYIYEHDSISNAATQPSVQAAAENGHLDIFRYLYENGGGPTNIEDVNSALQLAIANGHLNIIQYLTEYIDTNFPEI